MRADRNPADFIPSLAKAVVREMAHITQKTPGLLRELSRVDSGERATASIVGMAYGIDTEIFSVIGASRQPTLTEIARELVHLGNQSLILQLSARATALSDSTLVEAVDSLHLAGENPDLVIVGPSTYQWLVEREKRRGYRGLDREASVKLVVDRTCGDAAYIVLNQVGLKVAFIQSPGSEGYSQVSQEGIHLAAGWAEIEVRFLICPELVISPTTQILSFPP